MRADWDEALFAGSPSPVCRDEAIIAENQMQRKLKMEIDTEELESALRNLSPKVLFDLSLGTPLLFIVGHDYFYRIIAIIELAMIAS